MIGVRNGGANWKKDAVCGVFGFDGTEEEGRGLGRLALKCS